AAPACDPARLRAAHEFVREFTRRLFASSAFFVVGVGDEPCLEDGTPLIFDWTILESIHACIEDGAFTRVVPGHPISAFATATSLSDVPPTRRELWRGLLEGGAVQLIQLPAAFKSRSVLRVRQSHRGNVLVALGGGAGVEHLASLYSERNSAVLPIDMALG